MRKWIGWTALILTMSVQAGGKHEHAATAYAALEPLKQMVGDWEMFDKDGKSQGITRYTVTSGGSVVREILFPGSEHEMTNMYHLDGGSLVMTHYCAGGTQPRMRAQPAADGVVDFKFESVTNLKSKNDSYMGAMKFTQKDADNAVQEWTSFEGDKQTSWAFTMKRKKS